MEYALFVLFVVVIGFNIFVWVTLMDKLEIWNLKAKLQTKKFWAKHQKKVIKDLEALVVDMKNEIKNLNSTLDALEEGVIEMSDDDDDEDEDDEDEEDFAGIEAEEFDPKVVGH